MNKFEISGLLVPIVDRNTLPSPVELGKKGQPTVILLDEKSAAIWPSGKPIEQKRVLYQADEAIASSLDPNAW